jgi:predicted LPLAT superfamily acyltransferase
MCNNFLQQMEVDALEQLISEDVKVQGQISCVMVSELASRSSESLPELLPESSPELLPESSLEEMRSTSTTLLPRLSLEESALTSMRVDRFFLRVEEKPFLSMAGVAGVRQLGPCVRVRLPSPG